MPRQPVMTAHVLAAIGRDSLTPREIRRRAPAMSRGGLHAILSQQVQRGAVVTLGANPRRYSLAPGATVPPPPVIPPPPDVTDIALWFTNPGTCCEWRRPVTEADELRVA